MAIDYVRLKTEIEADAVTAGYARSGSDWRIGEQFNVTDLALRIPRDFVTAAELLEAIAPEDWLRITPTDAGRLQMVFISGPILINGPNTQALLNTIIPLTSVASRQAIAKLKDRAGSKAEKLFGAGARVTTEDVSLALRTG